MTDSDVLLLLLPLSAFGLFAAIGYFSMRKGILWVFFLAAASWFGVVLYLNVEAQKADAWGGLFYGIVIFYGAGPSAFALLIGAALGRRDRKKDA